MRGALVLVAAASLAATMPSAAQQFTKTFDYKPVNGIQAIEFGLDEVKVDQIVFRTAKDVATGPRNARTARPWCASSTAARGRARRRRRGGDGRGGQHRRGGFRRHENGLAGAGRARFGRDPVPVRLSQSREGQEVHAHDRGRAQGQLECAGAGGDGAVAVRSPLSAVSEPGHVPAGIARHLDVRAAADRPAALPARHRQAPSQ